MKKKITPLTDCDNFPFGPHAGQRMDKVPAIYLLSLVGSKELKAHPEVSAYIDRALRMLKAEVAEAEKVKESGDHD